MTMMKQVKSIVECSKGSILQYFQPSLSYHSSLRFLFCLFFSGRFTEVLHRFYCIGLFQMTMMKKRILTRQLDSLTSGPTRYTSSSVESFSPPHKP